MLPEKISKNLKIKTEDVIISVTADNLVDTRIEQSLPVKNLHYHLFYELFFAIDHPLSLYTADGIVVFDNCFVCIPPYCKHRTLAYYGQRILFKFEAHKPTSVFSKFMNSFFNQNEPIKIAVNDSLLFLHNELTHAFEFDSNICDDALTSILKLLFYNIYIQNNTNHHCLSQKPVYSTNESYLSKIDDLFGKFKNDLSLKTIADSLSLSTKQVSRIIKKNYNKTFSELLTEKKLSLAVELLLYSNKTILEISEYANFSSESYFYKKFKEAYGCTPLKYKKTQGK